MIWLKPIVARFPTDDPILASEDESREYQEGCDRQYGSDLMPAYSSSEVRDGIHSLQLRCISDDGNFESEKFPRRSTHISEDSLLRS